MIPSIDLNKLYELLLSTEGVCTDTRHIVSGTMFVALRGEHFDGNRFALDALRQGCCYALVDDETLVEQTHDESLRSKLLYYKDGGTRALQQLASLHRSKIGATVIGLTGTNGKTTTKELIAAVLSTQYKVHATQGNYNNEIGVPLTLLKVRPEHQFVIVEMGASHIGDIALLASLARPDYGIITNIGRAHLAGFGSPEGVVKAKGELYEYLRENGGTAFCNGDDRTLTSILSGVDAVLYGDGDGSCVSGKLLPTDDSGLLRIEWQDRTTAQTYELQTQLVGAYNLNNLLAAIAVGLHFGLSSEQINAALAAYHPENQRSQVLPLTIHGNRVILDCYNANPSSMEVALDSFFEMQSGGLQRMLVLGDMNELGEVAEKEHVALIRLIQGYLLRHPKMVAYLCGPEFFSLQAKYGGEHFIFFPTAQALKQYFSRHSPQHCFILIKGSNSHRLSEVANLC